MEQNKLWSQSIDSDVNPADDFFHYVNSKWINEYKIPDDMSRWCMFNILDENNTKKINDILKEDIDKRIKNLHQGYLNKSGKDDLYNIIKTVSKINNMEEMLNTLYSFDLYQITNNPINFYVYANLNDSENNILYGSTSGLYLPDRDYYIKEDMKEKREKYIDFMENYITIVNKELDITIDKKVIFDFEKILAEWTHTKVMKRDPENYNNPTTIGEFMKNYPNLKLEQVLENVSKYTIEEMKEFPMNISNPTFFKNYNDFLGDESNYNILKQHTLWSLVLKLSLCSKEFETLKFDFYGKYMSGLLEMKPEWKRAVDYINSQLGELLGLEFCKKYFNEDSKKKCDMMVGYIIEELRGRLHTNDWMDEITKKQALIKLNKMRVKIGYPSEEGRRDLSKLVLDEDSFFKNHCMMNRFDSLFNLNEINTKKNKERFHMYPHMVNAYYSPVSNEIVFPAGILQWPFFNINMDMSENFGAIGVVIGHEITHGFDDQGRKYDGNGNLNDWWSESVCKKYAEKTNKIRDLFDSFQVNGRNVNGSLTLGENIADLGGLSISYHAYLKYINDYPSEDNIFDGFTSKQRFFLGFARVWCGHMRDEEMEKRIMTDPHSPAIFRVNGSLCNMEEFYETFKVEESNKLYLKKSMRGSVW